MKFQSIFIAAGFVLGLASCDNLLEFEPGDVILAEDAIQNADDLQRLLVSNYDVVANLYGGRVQIVNELRGPNFGAPDNSLDFTAVYNRETTFFTGINGGIYTDFYFAIYRSNVVIKNFEIVQDLDEQDQIRLEAEARFIRAICHWGAVKLYARPYGYTADNSHPGVPLRIAPTQDPLPRASVAEVYAQVIDDLTFAAENLPIENGVYATSMPLADIWRKYIFSWGNMRKPLPWLPMLSILGRLSWMKTWTVLKPISSTLKPCLALSVCPLIFAVLGSGTTCGRITTQPPSSPSVKTLHFS